MAAKTKTFSNVLSEKLAEKSSGNELGCEMAVGSYTYEDGASDS